MKLSSAKGNFQNNFKKSEHILNKQRNPNPNQEKNDAEVNE